MPELTIASNAVGIEVVSNGMLSLPSSLAVVGKAVLSPTQWHLTL